MPNSSNKLLFRLFADDTNMLFSSKDMAELETTVNLELAKVLKYCSVNKLSINFKKTNYMVIASPRKKVNLSITSCKIEQKIQIKNGGTCECNCRRQTIYHSIILKRFNETSRTEFCWRCAITFI